MMSLVWELDLPDSEKLVLLALADCANDEGHCWPGMKTLTDKCSKSDRTIQGCIRTLCAKGHLTRRETPGKGCNYTVHPIVRFGANELRHYTYKTTRIDTGEFYIGARSCFAEPSNDPYVGSGRWVQGQVATGAPLQKTIIAEYPSRDELALAEQETIAEYFDDPLCRNAKRSAAGSLPRPYTPEESAGRWDSGATGAAHTPEAISDTPEAASGKPSKNHQEPSDDSASGDAPSLRPEHIQEKWNDDIAPVLARPTIRDLTPERRQLVKARIAQYSLEDFQTVFAKCRDSPFLRGDRGRTPLTFDWIMKKGNFQKTLEGNYD
jgi:hypothetical protein